MKYIVWTLNLSLLFVLGACAPKVGTSNLKISIAAITGSVNFPGGLVVMGQHKGTKQKIIRKIGDADTIELELENGTWDFSAIGWSGGDIFEENSYCDIKLNMNLDGNDFPLTFNTTKLKCGNPIFGAQVDNKKQFYPLTFHTCMDIKQYIAAGDSVPANIDCGASNKEMFEGGLRSFRITFDQILPEGGTSPGLESKCLNVTDAKAISNIKLPFGSNIFGLKYIVKGYGNTNCGGAESIFTFPKGFLDKVPGDIGAALTDTSTGNINLLLHSDACVGNHLTNLPYAAGSTSSGVYLICNKAQFENIANGVCPATTTGLTSMGCEVDATYVLGQDILFGGSNTTITNLFKGQLIGNNHSLSNGNNPLFDNIQTNSTMDVRISDFDINGFVIDETLVGVTGYGRGILVNNISDGNVPNKIEISEINIDSTSSIKISYPVGSTSFVGGLIGQINFSGANSDEELYVREINSFANVTGLDDPDIIVGGLVGKVIGDGGGAQISFEYNKVGVHNDNDLSDTSKRVLLQGQQKVGGMAGQSQYAEFRDGSKAIVEIRADSHAGGVVGDALAKTDIFNTYVDMKFVHRIPITANRIGGIVGNIGGDYPVKINGAVVKFDVPEPISSSYTMNLVGGVVGNAYSYTTSSLHISNTRSYFTIKANGDRHGGIIGQFKDATGPTSSVIMNSVAMGYIDEDTNSAANTQKGGFAGYAEFLKTERSIAHFTRIEGDSVMGGGYGVSVESAIKESHILAELECQGSSAPLDCGGIVGIHSASAAANNYQDIYSDVDIDVDNVTGFDCNTYGCGTIVGKNTRSGFRSFERIIAMGDITDGGAATHTNFCPTISGSYCGGPEINSNQSDNTSCSTVGTVKFSMDGSDCQMLFETQWQKFGSHIIGSIDSFGFSSFYKAGSLVEPFVIADENMWNDIDDDVFLMDKYFILLADLDFTTPAFEPIGSVLNKFRGGIIPNGKTLKNITFSAGSSHHALFHEVDNARIGMFWPDPLKIDGLNLTCSSYNDCGVIALANNSDISVVVKNAVITSSGQNVGGILGKSLGRNYIHDSGFEGQINGNLYFGGIVGRHDNGGGGETLTIKNSYVKAKKLLGNGYVGGFVGVIANAADKVEIENSYFVINPNGDSGTNFSGGTELSLIVGGLDGNISGKNIFVDVRNLIAGNTVYSLAQNIGSASGSFSDYVVVNNGKVLVNDYSAPNAVVALQTDLDPDVFEQGDEHSDWRINGANIELFWESNIVWP